MACVDAERTRPIGPDELIHWPEEDGLAASQAE